jgi:hypothetical protein
VPANDDLNLNTLSSIENGQIVYESPVAAPHKKGFTSKFLQLLFIKILVFVVLVVEAGMSFSLKTSLSIL